MRQIHATNITGLGASQVVMSFLQAWDQLDIKDQTILHLPEVGALSNFRPSRGFVRTYRRILPNPVSRFVECLFSFLIFENVPTIVLGDIPLRGIKSQIVLVHQANLVNPKINPFSSKKIKYRFNRFLFRINHRYAKKIIVQTGAMAKELVKSYPKIKDKVIISPQPVPAWLDTCRKEKQILDGDKVAFFYPSAAYPHKRHDFLLKTEDYLKSNNCTFENIEIWLTLKDEDFKAYSSIKWVKNLGVLNTEQMNAYYKEADALLFLSSIESYGLPLVEALTINLPILVVDLPYSRWLCGDSVFYFKPYDEKSFIKSVNICESNIRNGHPHSYTSELLKFPKSWSDVANTFVNALK